MEEEEREEKRQKEKRQKTQEQGSVSGAEKKKKKTEKKKKEMRRRTRAVIDVAWMITRLSDSKLHAWLAALSCHGARLYGYPASSVIITLERVPPQLASAAAEELRSPQAQALLVNAVNEYRGEETVNRMLLVEEIHQEIEERSRFVGMCFLQVRAKVGVVGELSRDAVGTLTKGVAKFLKAVWGERAVSFVNTIRGSARGGVQLRALLNDEDLKYVRSQWDTRNPAVTLNDDDVLLLQDSVDIVFVLCAWTEAVFEQAPAMAQKLMKERGLKAYVVKMSD